MLKSNITFTRKKRVFMIFFIFALLMLAAPMRSSAMRNANTGTLTAEITNQSFTFDSNQEPFPVTR